MLFEMLSTSKKTKNTSELQPKEVYEEYAFSQKKKIYVKINLAGFFWSKDFDLNKEKEKKDSKDDNEGIGFIYIRDLNGNES